MPTYKFEAMDTSGEEVKDEIEATNEEEAQQKIKQMGYFVTKLTAVGTKAKGKKKKAAGYKKSKKTFVPAAFDTASPATNIAAPSGSLDLADASARAPSEAFTAARMFATASGSSGDTRWTVGSCRPAHSRCARTYDNATGTGGARKTVDHIA